MLLLHQTILIAEGTWLNLHTLLNKCIFKVTCITYAIRYDLDVNINIYVVV